MKAAVVTRYGPPEVVEIREVPTPVPGPNEVLVRGVATTVNSGDARIRALRVPAGLSLMMRLALGWSGPKRPINGFEMAGDVAAVGPGVTKYKPGDRVIASRRFDLGAHAEYLVVGADQGIAHIPDRLSYEDAVALPFGAATALYYLRKGELKAGERLLINGGSGAVGVMALQIAKQMGVHVTAVCSGRNAELVRSLGADEVIDYTAEDFTKRGETWNVIMENHGNAQYHRVKHLLAPNGRFLLVIGDLRQMIQSPWAKQMVTGNQKGEAITPESFAEIMAMGAGGTLKPVIDRVLPFTDIVEAYRRVDSDHKVGSVVLTF
jgi:NADPH:quinone reductase-like Zn-dependent oxidoreductase